MPRHRDSARMRSQPRHYPSLSFHLVRLISLVSTSVVTGILIFFLIALHRDGFKLPWTFIIVLASSLALLITTLLSLTLYHCSHLSTLLSLIANITTLTLYLAGYGLLTWNITGTLSHTCSAANWASDDGMLVCRVYKAFYSFEIFGLLALLAMIVLDVRARRQESISGRYDKMEGAGVGGARPLLTKDVSLQDLNESRGTGTRPAMHAHAESHDSVPYTVGDYSTGNDHARLRDHGAAASYYNGGGGNDYGNGNSYSAYNPYSQHQQAGYGNGGYGYAPQR